MSSHPVPGDQAFHDDKQLMADLSALGERLSRYVLRHLDADAGRGQPVSVTDEQAFAEALRAMADRVQDRANRRTTPGASSTLEGDARLRGLTEGRPSERC